MCDGKGYLYILPASEEVTTDDRIRGILASRLGCTPDRIQVARSPLGKPYLPQHPDIQLSVSHSGEWFVCAVSSQPVGVDLQEHTPLRGETREYAAQRYSKIARRFFHRQEAEFVLEDPQNHFFVVWTAKESYVKFTGKGMDDTYADFCVVNEALYLQLLLNEKISWQAENVFFHLCSFRDNYTLCLCTAAPCSWEWIFESPETE